MSHHDLTVWLVGHVTEHPDVEACAVSAIGESMHTSIIHADP